ncbi:MAG TPA: hypothetical protein VGK73_22085, partial [Polyangiaceae bacterium]
NGTCQVPQTVGGGDPCGDPDIVCDAGFYCNGENCIRIGYVPNDPDATECSADEDCKAADTCIDEICVPRCTFNELCGAEGRCRFEEGATEGYCAPLLAPGEGCSLDEECLSGFCHIGATTPQCREFVILTGESSLCTNL